MISAVARNCRNVLFRANQTKCCYTQYNFLKSRLLCTQYSDDINFKQLFDEESCTYTYLLSDMKGREAILIDPVIEKVDRDLNFIKEMELHLKYVVNTHMHADHITGSGLIKTLLPHTKSIISEYSGAIADIHVKHGDQIQYGDQTLEVRSTPGHTNGCVTFVDHRHCLIFTGDALLIHGCGRTDFQEGCPKKLYESVHNELFSLPNHYLVYPAHDYNGKTVSTIDDEKRFNPRLTKTLKEFVEIMEHLGLPYPEKIDMSLPANKVCGLYNLPTNFEKLIEEAKKKKT